MARRSVPPWQSVVAIFLAALGFLVVVQLRSRQSFRQEANLPSWRLQDLAVLVREQEAARGLLQAEIETLRRQVAEYEAAVVEGRGLTDAMAKDLAQFRLVLGLVPVAGPGVRVVVAEDGGGPGGVLPSIAQAQDLAGLANELWAAGAEAVAINGVRILASSGIRQADSRVVVAGAALQAPYRIEAIGNAELLRAGLAIRGGFVDGLQSVGLKVSVQTHARLRLPPRLGVDPLRWSRPTSTP